MTAASRPQKPLKSPETHHSVRLRGWERPVSSLRRVLSYPALLPGVADFLIRNPRVASEPAPYTPKVIDRTAFGINITSGPDEKTDDYLVARLRELGVGCVRIDYGYGKANRRNTERIVRRLADEGFRILLHLVPPRREALRANNKAVFARWKSFIRGAIKRFGDLAEAFEIGSTPNRYGWAGFSVTNYVRWVATGMHPCRQAGITCYGPNVTDFSPLYNAGLLWLLKRHGVLPDVHTNNLFVDRALEPERRDPKVLSRASSQLHMNLPNKAAFLSAVSRHFGIPSTCCTYTYWTLNVKSASKARYVSEERYADYLVRYLLLALTCGALDRVYWGQMISFAKGLIDDASGITPVTPTVHHQWHLYGRVENYRVRPAFHAYANLTRLLGEGVQFLRRVESPPNVFLLEFEEPGGGRLLIGWTVDGMAYEAADHVRNSDVVEVTDVYGKTVSDNPGRLSQSPRILRLRAEARVTDHDSKAWDGLGRIHPPSDDEEWIIVDSAAARGFVRESRGGVLQRIAEGGTPADPEIRHTILTGSNAREDARRIFSAAAALDRNTIEYAPLLGVLETTGGHIHIFWQMRRGERLLSKVLTALDPEIQGEREQAEGLLAQAAELVRRLNRRGMLHGSPDAEAFVLREGGEDGPEVLLSPARFTRLHVTRRVSLLRRLSDVLRFDPGPGWRLLSVRVRLRRQRERRSAARIRRRGVST